MAPGVKCKADSEGRLFDKVFFCVIFYSGLRGAGVTGCVRESVMGGRRNMLRGYNLGGANLKEVNPKDMFVFKGLARLPEA